VDISRGGYKSPEYWILKTIMQHLENGQKVMLLASCSYMLHPVIAVLRQWGIPFTTRTGNPPASGIHCDADEKGLRRIGFCPCLAITRGRTATQAVGRVA